MRRREVSNNELNQVIKLKEAGASWLKIQNKTRVPRRSAKRAYEDWQRSQSMEELKTARVNVAGEALREHVDSLIKLAKSLAMHLDVPQSPNDARNAKQFLDSLWERGILGESKDYQLSQDVRKRERQRIIREYEMLLKSFQDHTREKVRWELLDEWKHSWDQCIKVLGEFWQEGREIIGNILDLKEGLLSRIREGSGENDPLERIAEAVLRTIWQRILDDKLDPGCPVVRTMLYGDGTTLVTLPEFSDNAVLRFTAKTLAEEAGDVCNWAARNLCIVEKEGMITSLVNDVCTMRRAIEELTEMLNPLVLRPLILRTRCDLCPA